MPCGTPPLGTAPPAAVGMVWRRALTSSYIGAPLNGSCPVYGFGTVSGFLLTCALTYLVVIFRSLGFGRVFPEPPPGGSLCFTPMPNRAAIPGAMEGGRAAAEAVGVGGALA